MLRTTRTVESGRVRIIELKMSSKQLDDSIFTYFFVSHKISVRLVLSSTNCIPGISARHGLTINDRNHDTRISSDAISETNVFDRCGHLFGAMFHFNEKRRLQSIALNQSKFSKL